MSDTYEIEVLKYLPQKLSSEWETVATADGFVKAVSLLIDLRASSNASTRLTIR